MQIEAGKYYRTRDGRKADVQREWGLNGSDYQYHGEICEGETGLLWKNDGTNYDGPDSPKSLVAEWSDSPVRTVTRREIVDGLYGIVAVYREHGKTRVTLTREDGTPDQLEAAARTLQQLVEALREG